MPKGFLAWHPDVHRRFGERLFFFLLALKPYRHQAFTDALHKLLDEFGVSVKKNHEGYCSYELLGDLDFLLRVWLPADQEVRFIEQAHARLPNLSKLIQLSVQSVVWDWRFLKPPAEKDVESLAPSTVIAQQSAQRPEDCEDVTKLGLAKWVREAVPNENQPDPFKAFISLKPPDKFEETQLKWLREELVTLITESDKIDDCTFYVGIGFTWLLVKVVAGSFSSLSQLVSRIGTEFGAVGLSSSTYAVTVRRAEGDSIAVRAPSDGPEFGSEILKFIPALRGPCTAPKDVRVAVADFIRDTVLVADLKEDDKTPLRELLAAVLMDEEDAAIQPLFLPTINREREVRGRLLHLVQAHDGKLDWLIRFSKDVKQEFKTPDTIALGFALLAANEKLKELAPGAVGNSSISEEEIKRVTKVRNMLMHGARFHLAKDWQLLATHLLTLYRIRDVFIPALDECLRQLAQSV